ncbi:MAG: ABC transporter ATP-binding protein [Nitrososphaerales archaeon]
MEVKGISKYFGGVRALKDLSFDVIQGEFLGLIGPNGAGKTTLFNIICGEYKPNHGYIKFKGENIISLQPYDICKKGISRTYQLVKPFLNLTVFQNALVGALFGRDKSDSRKAVEFAEEALKLVGLQDKRDVLVKHLSTLDRKKVELARAVATNPILLLLDEPVAGLNPKETEEVLTIINEIHKNDVTIFMIEHDMKTIMSYSNRIIVLHNGEKIAEGTPREVASNNQVIEAYLGAPSC